LSEFLKTVTTAGSSLEAMDAAWALPRGFEELEKFTRPIAEKRKNGLVITDQELKNLATLQKQIADVIAKLEKGKVVEAGIAAEFGAGKPVKRDKSGSILLPEKPGMTPESLQDRLKELQKQT